MTCDDEAHMYPVDASRITVPDSLEAMTRELAEALETMYAMLTPEQADIIRRGYEEESGGRVYAVPGNEALANAFARVYALEDAIRDAEFDAFQREMVFERSTRVIVAVLDALTPRDAKVIMMRTDLNDLGRNYILVRRDAVSVESIAVGLERLESSRRRVGDIPTKRIRSIVREVRSPRRTMTPGVSKQIAGAIDGIASAPPVAIPGYGEVPAVTITVGPVAREGSGR
jgi:hypothetical protein